MLRINAESEQTNLGEEPLCFLSEHKREGEGSPRPRMLRISSVQQKRDLPG